VPFLTIRPEPSSQLVEAPAGGRSSLVEAPGQAGRTYVFDYWLGDDLIGSSPLFLVTERLKAALLALDPPGGFAFEPASVEASAFMKRSSPDKRLPVFWKWRIEGRAGLDDVGLWGADLVVSGRVFAALLSCSLEQAEILQFRRKAPAGA
jgi:hypothetical protein